MQRSEGNEASFFLHSSLPKGVERRRRGGEEERAGDEKRTETVEENWEEKRHAYASREKERCNPLLSLSLSRCNSISPRFHSGRRSSPRENRSLLLSKFAKLGPSLPASLSNIFPHDDVPLPVELKKKKLPNYFPDRVNKRNVKSCAVIFLNRGTVAVSKENY